MKLNKFIPQTNPIPTLYIESKNLVPELSNQTFGSLVSGDMRYIGLDCDYISDSISNVQKLNNPETKDLALNLLYDIQWTIEKLKYIQCDIGSIPKLNTYVSENNDLMVEFTADNYRIGFNIDNNKLDSGWYLATDENIGEIGASGYLREPSQVKKMVLWLLLFCLIHR